jgi:redox-regulated HSP33 family molecular chaperone
LEERWESLRDLGKKYKALEKVAMESETILKKLTGDEKI